jgi:hypothetical protein
MQIAAVYQQEFTAFIRIHNNVDEGDKVLLACGER